MTAVRVRSEEVTWQLVDDDVVVLDLASATYLRLVGAGTVLWPLIVEGRDDTELAACLVTTFDVDEDVARADVAEFLHDLLDHDLVVVDAGTGGDP